jgi:hypothetical protein
MVRRDIWLYLPMMPAIQIHRNHTWLHIDLFPTDTTTAYTDCLAFIVECGSMNDFVCAPRHRSIVKEFRRKFARIRHCIYLIRPNKRSILDRRSCSMSA